MSLPAAARRPAGDGAPRSHDPGVRGVRRWPGLVAIGVALALYVVLPERLTAGPRWVLPALGVALIAGVLLATPRRSRHVHRLSVRRALGFALLGLVAFANVVSLALLVRLLLDGGKANGRELVVSAAAIWLTNVIVFGLVYWELDRGGPEERARHAFAPPGATSNQAPASDFLFPQMNLLAGSQWCPGFLDYLYIAYTNATAFSPTDAMPLTARVKTLMMVQSFASLVTVGLVAARAVNILNG